MRVARLLAMVAVLAGCRTRLPGFDGEPQQALRDLAPPPDMAFDASPPERPVVVHAVGGTTVGINLDDVQGTEDRFAVSWSENVSGRLVVGAAVLDGMGRLLNPPFRSAVRNMAESTVVAWSPAGLRLFWVEWDDGGRLRIKLQRLLADGTPIGQPSVIRDGPGNASYLQSASWSSDSGLFRVVYVDDRNRRFHYQPYYLATDDTGVLRAEAGPLVEDADQLEYARGAGTAVHLLHTVRTPNADTRAYASWFDDRGAGIGQPLQIYSARNIQHGSGISWGQEMFAGLWHVDRGPVLVRVQRGGPVSIVDLGADFARPWLAVAPSAAGEPVVGALLPNYRPGNLSNRLAFRRVTDGNTAGPVVDLDVVPVTGGACIEAHRIAYGAGTFAALWQEGCEGPRTVYFLRLGGP